MFFDAGDVFGARGAPLDSFGFFDRNLQAERAYRQQQQRERERVELERLMRAKQQRQFCRQFFPHCGPQPDASRRSRTTYNDVMQRRMNEKRARYLQQQEEEEAQLRRRQQEEEEAQLRRRQQEEEEEEQRQQEEEEDDDDGDDDDDDDDEEEVEEQEEAASVPPPPSPPSPSVDTHPAALAISSILKAAEAVRARHAEAAFATPADEKTEKARRHYEEELLQQVLRLDSVCPEGNAAIRRMRKEAVVRIEGWMDALHHFIRSNEQAALRDDTTDTSSPSLTPRSLH